MVVTFGATPTLPASLHTTDHQCFNVKFGVFNQDVIAVSSAVNFGMKGPGRLYIFDINNPTPLTVMDTSDALYDVAWSEQSPNVIAAAQADGSILLFQGNRQVYAWKRLHSREVGSVDWNLVSKDTILAASYDGTVSILDPKTTQSRKLHVGNCAYEACWHPRDPFTFCVVTADASIQVWDTRQHHQPVQMMKSAHGNEILCADWNKYESSMIATGSVDQQVKIWDLRSPSATTPFSTLNGHYRAVRRVKFDPFNRNNLASCGYDMTVRTWNLNSLNPMSSKPHSEHTEFVLGLAYSLKRPGLLASCSWDDSIHFIDTV